jgi:GT2 family glycosyltransferase
VAGLSIVIVNWNTVDYLRRCLRSILLYPPSGEYEVIVVDNASADGSAQMASSEFGRGVTLIENQENVGYAKGNNQGLAVASGERILLLNPDTEVTQGAIDALEAFADGHPDAGAIGCRLVDVDGYVQRSCRSFPHPLGILFEYIGLSRLFPGSKLFGSYRMTYFDYAGDAQVDQPMASCLLMPRKALDNVGMFDEDFPIFFNDVDWCYRAKQMGWNVWFTFGAKVIHHGGRSTNQIRRSMVLESHRSFKKFYAKYYKHRLPSLVYWGIMAAIDINAAVVSRWKSW